MTGACAALVALTLAHASPAAAQVDPELLDVQGGGGPDTSDRQDPWRLAAFLGGGAGVRILRNRDFNQTFLAPAYLEVGAIGYLPGRGLRHGLQLNVSSNLSVDGGSESSRIGAFEQYTVTASYVLALPLRYFVDGMEYDWLQIQGRVGAPVAITLFEDGAAVAPGVEAAVALQFKFLSGLGVYLEVAGDIFFGTADNVFPFLTFDAGVVWDYEFLP